MNRFPFPGVLVFLLTACGAAFQAPHHAESVAVAPAPMEESGSEAEDDAGALEAGPVDARLGASPSPEVRHIRTGHVSVAVTDYAPFSRELEAWLSAAGGFVSDASLSHVDGEVSHASLTVRVPAARLDGLVGWTEERLRVESLSITSRDVTAEWVDVEARIENQRRAEARLRGLLDTSTGSLTDVLAVERELARVRGGIEAAEGRMRVLSDQVGLATLELSVRVDRPYAARVSPTFGEEAAAVFSGSLSAMGRTARGLGLVGIAALPWLTPPALVAGGLVVILRRRRRAMAVG